MALSVNSFATMVSNQAAAIQTACKTLVSFTSGSILRAAIQANSAVAMWLQGLVLQVTALSRFASSYGPDADSWGAQWGFFRATGNQATGFVTFARYTPTNYTLIPVGAQVQTADGSQIYTVVAQPGYANWNAGDGYDLNGGVASIQVPVQSVNFASAANAAAGTVSVLLQAISGVDYCSNALPMTLGLDPESDDAYKARFPTFLLSLARGTGPAIVAAVEAIQVGVQCTVIPNVALDGTPQAGYLTIIVDDGTGSPSTALLNQAGTAVLNYIAEGMTFGIFPPTIITINVSFSIMTKAGYVHADAVTAAQNAVISFIDALADGTSLAWSQIEGVIQNSSPAVFGVYNLLLNGSTADITLAGPFDVTKVGTVVGT